MKRDTRLLLSGASSAALGFGLVKPVVPRKTNTLIKSSEVSMAKLKNRRLRLARVPSIYVGQTAQKSFKALTENA